MLIVINPQGNHKENNLKLTQYYMSVISQLSWEKRKTIQFAKKEVKLCLFTGDILFIGNPKEFMKKTIRTNKLAKLQDTRSPHNNQLNFYAPTVNSLKM